MIQQNINEGELKEKLARAVCLFLAEMLRTRQVSLRRGAEIAAQIVEQLEEIKSEMHFLEIVRELEYEFQELRYLENDLVFLSEVGERKYMESLVREYAVRHLPDNPEAAVEIMQEALLQESDLESLSKKFSDFAMFINKKLK